MSDYEKLNKLLTEFGVGFTERRSKDGVVAINCEAGDKKVGGYAGYFTEFLFDASGDFINIEIFE